MDDVVVTQADRVAYNNLMYDEAYDDPEWGSSLFARHRIDSQRPLIEALEKARRFMKPEDFDLEYIDAAIKQAKGE